MIDQTDFKMKQFIFYVPMNGDKMSFKNDNIIIKDKEATIRFQITCYRVFLIFVVGDTTITTGLLSRANKYGFSICLMNRNMKVYKFISSRMEGNTHLRKIQYSYDDMQIGQYIIYNKVRNQRNVLSSIRNKNQLIKDAIVALDSHIERLCNDDLEMNSILGIEGSASRTYFCQVFNMVTWNGRKPRIKNDYLNATLDIGYTILFNIIDALLNVYGFDEYYGVLHRCFYMRKSLVCDLMEPFRPVIDYTVRKGINLGQIKENDFKNFSGRYVLEWKMSPAYTKIFLDALLEYKTELFLYIQSYYRAFMKQKNIYDYPIFKYME